MRGVHRKVVEQRKTAEPSALRVPGGGVVCVS